MSGPGIDRPKFEDGSLTVGAARVRWRSIGAGPDIVFLPGFPLSSETWDGVASRLGDRFRCTAFDLVGLGASTSADAQDFSSPGQGRVFQRAIADLGIRSYALVGNDTGGWIARELALLDSERITHLVLTNTEIPGHRPPWIPMYQALAALPGFGPVLRLLLRSRAFCHSRMGFGGTFHDRSRIDGGFRRLHIERLIRSAAAIEGARVFLRRMKFTRIDEFATLHRRLTMPTLLIWGADDPTFPVSRARELTSQFPNIAGMETVADAKLFFYEEQADLVGDRIGRLVSGA